MSEAFKNANPALQEIVRELDLVRRHNLSFKQTDPQRTYLGFAEAMLVFLALEHFLRVIVRPENEDITLAELLERAHSTGLVKIPQKDVVSGIKIAVEEIARARNTLLHGNFEQAAKQANCPDVATYFKTQFMPEVERMTYVLDELMVQVGLEKAPVPKLREGSKRQRSRQKHAEKKRAERQASGQTTEK